MITKFLRKKKLMRWGALFLKVAAHSSFLGLIVFDKSAKNRSNRSMKNHGSFAFVILLISSVLSGSFASAKSSTDSFPAPKKGGTFTDAINLTPTMLNPILITNMDDRAVSGWLNMSLWGRDYETYNDLPGLAEKIDVSKDKKEYTFSLDPKAKWSDGTAVTSDDVVFTFEKIMDPKIDAATTRSFLAGVTIEKIDGLKFKFKVETPKYDTQDFLGSIHPIQKKQFEKEADFNRSKENLRPVGNGPYKLKQISRDQFVTLERDTNWWAKDQPANKASSNFDTLQLKIISDNSLRYETWIKGNLDTVNLSIDQFGVQVKGADKDKIGTKPNSGKAIWAKALPSDGSLPWYGIALNLKNPMFAGVKTRQALAYLIDYDKVIKDLYFGLVGRTVSPFGSRTDNVSSDLKNLSKAYRYDFKKAADLLKADGWADTDGDNVLDKEIGGKRIAFKFTYKVASANAVGVKFGQFYKEVLKKAGIHMDVQSMDASALYKDFDDKAFEALLIGWGGGSIFPNPRQNWATSSIDGGSNKVSYSNPKVDVLIEKANLEFNRKKRAKMLQEIGSILYADLPYIFLYERNAVLQGFNSKIKSPRWIARYGIDADKDLFHY
jgi:ABC-type transport system substrate-binding protein